MSAILRTAPCVAHSRCRSLRLFSRTLVCTRRSRSSAMLRMMCWSNSRRTVRILAFILWAASFGKQHLVSSVCTGLILLKIRLFNFGLVCWSSAPLGCFLWQTRIYARWSWSSEALNRELLWLAKNSIRLITKLLKLMTMCIFDVYLTGSEKHTSTFHRLPIFKKIIIINSVIASGKCL